MSNINKDNSRGTDQTQNELDDFQKEDLPLDTSKREDTPIGGLTSKSQRSAPGSLSFERKPATTESKLPS